MNVLTVPNWSFGRDPDLLERFGEILAEADVRVHYLQSDPDHNRTVSAFSGEPGAVSGALMRLGQVAFARLDMLRHHGVHPFLGALDVCPFIFPEPPVDDGFVVDFAAQLAHQYEIPVFLYEKSERGRHAPSLPELRRGGFDALIDSEFDPDFGPGRANARLGASIVGTRDFLIAMNVNLPTTEVSVAKQIAREVRLARDSGEVGFAGVRSLGFALPSRSQVQVSFNLTRPDETRPDDLVRFVTERTPIAETELIGVIRQRDLPGSTLFSVEPAQIVW